MKPLALDVSDNAVLTYLEQVWGLDVAKLRREIAHAAAPSLGHPTCDAVRQGKFLFFVREGMVTGVQQVSLPNRRTGRIRRERAE